jgi:hypothetical protein
MTNTHDDFDHDFDDDNFDDDDFDEDDFDEPPLCVDCGVNTCPTEMGPRAEEYIVLDEVWAAAAIPPNGGHLCIGCLEGRLSRQLTASDFTDVPLNDLSIADDRYAWSWRTPSLISRLSGRPGNTTTKGTPK